MTTQTPIPTLDALPLPVPTHFRNGVLYAFSADQIRADRIKVWELAMRKALEGREPVAWRIHPHDYGVGSAGVYAVTQLSQQKDAWLKKGWAPEPLYTSPPPKSDEARDAERYRMLRDFDSGKTELAICRWSEDVWVGEWVIEHEPDAAIDAALAAQQKGGE